MLMAAKKSREAFTVMRANKLKQIWASGGAALNGWLSIPSAASAEMMAHQGFDSLTIDLQHGLMDYSDALGMLQAISTTDVVPMARVPWLEEGNLMKMLDAGAMAIICPMINTGAECERFVSACRYAPRGRRSHGPIRASLYAGADYLAHADQEVALLAMVETRQAVDNLDDILAVPGLDGVYIGPSDLAMSLGVKPGFDPTDTLVRGAIAKVVAATRAKGLVAGIHCGEPEFALEMVSEGFQFVTVGSDSRFMTAGARTKVAAFRSGIGGEQPAGKAAAKSSVKKPPKSVSSY
jgi:4-hydroxy-2-oxoheptanedioate aldolase